MSDSPKTPHPLIALRLEHKNTYDAVAMLLYLVLVYGWGLWIYPLGRDYHALANGWAEMPVGVRHLFALEVGLFGDFLPGYHLVNIALMYACMLLIYHFVNQALGGLWWFGTLAASLFMANPVHSEAMHNLSGVADLVPCLAGLAALTACAWNAATPHPAKLAAASLAAVFAAGAYPENAMLGPVLLAFELLVVRKKARSYGRGIAVGALALAAAAAAGTVFPRSEFDPGQMFGPLYLVFYPIGFLPKTLESFHERPWAAWLAAATVAIAIGLIHRKARRPEFFFAILAMLLLRAVPAERPVDLTHMIGGGQLLLPNALFVLGFIVIVYRIMDHPRWRVPMITITTTLVIVFFAMQWRSIKHWRDAGAYVQEVRAQANAARERGGPLGLLPDYRCYHGAPVCQSDAVLDTVPLLPLHTQSVPPQGIEIKSWDESGGEVLLPKVDDAPLYTYFPTAHRIAFDTQLRLKDVWGPTMPEGTFAVSRQPDGALLVTLRGSGLPTTLLPGTIATQSPGGETGRSQ